MHKFKLNDQSLEIDLGTGQLSQFHYVWLRDNCPCSQCKHADTRERILVTSEIPEDLKALNAKLAGDEIVIRWNDSDHESRFRLDWLNKHNYSNARFEADPAAGTPIIWGRALQDAIPSFDYSEMHNDRTVLLSWCEAVRDYGLTIIRNAPLEEGEIERLADYIGVVREVIYDRLHNVRATPGEYNAYNVASTTLELKPHTDMPNYNNPPGVQMFHLLLNESVGGESTAVDGMNIAAKLKAQDPDAYQILATTPVQFRMFSARGDVIASNPLLTLDTFGELKVFRFSNQLAQPSNLSPDKMEAFYAAYRKLGRLIEDHENRVQFRLETGDIMVTNNLRVMHGRNAYDPSTGGRHLQLSYMDFDDVMSRIRMLKKEAA